MANGSFFGDLKSKLGRLGSSQNGSRNQQEYEDEYADYDNYDEYDNYSQEYDDYDNYDEYDPYMDRNPVTKRSAKSDPGLPRLVSMDDARASARDIPPRESRGGIGESRESRSSSRESRSSSIRSYGRMMVDSSLPPSMTAEGTAAASAAINRKASGLDSLFGSPQSNSASTNVLRDSMQLSMPGMRRLKVIRPTKYNNAEDVTTALKANDVAILVLTKVDQSLMMRLLDFSFGAASAMDATVESIGHKVFAICRSVGLDDREREELSSMGII